MALMRQSTIDQMNRINKEIKKEGGAIDLSVPSEKTAANGLWDHDPFEANRKGKRRIATIEDMMTIDIPNERKVLKFGDFVNENFQKK